MQCNSCLESQQGEVYITSCSHLLCAKCAKQQFNSSNKCPLCDTVLDSNGVFLHNLAPSSSKTLALFGSDPAFIMQSALKAIDFHEHQVMEIARRKVAEQQRADGDKLAMLSRQLDSLHSENSGLQRECSDLRSRLSQRLAQDQAASERQQASLSNSLVRQQDDEFNRNKHINHAPAASISPRREPRSPGLSLGSFGHASPLRPRSQDRPPQHHNESAAGPILPSGNYSLPRRDYQLPQRPLLSSVSSMSYQSSAAPPSQHQVQPRQQWPPQQSVSRHSTAPQLLPISTAPMMAMPMPSRPSAPHLQYGHSRSDQPVRYPISSIVPFELQRPNTPSLNRTR